MRFEVGDTVVVQANYRDCNAPKFHGMKCVVTDGEYPGKTHLQPLSARPDGYNYNPFYWYNEHLTLVDSSEYGQMWRIKETKSDFIWVHTEQGMKLFDPVSGELSDISNTFEEVSNSPILERINP